MADQGSEGLLSPYLRSQRIGAVRAQLRGRVLDIGCGSGALAGEVATEAYCGVERDAVSIAVARREYPGHRFVEDVGQLPADERFDSVVALAVIEHVSQPEAFLSMMARYLVDGPGGQVVVTTPHPSMDWIHDAGAKVGLFSAHASEEHETLLDRAALERAGNQAGLALVFYRRFLFGANQVAVYRPAGAARA